ncbi:class I adenylate-forming enzyme family protein [Spongiibacter tropicus]|uniref:class I adenylate-forming enzyme family protein n=1 Tax=Spongiibacter tropicus TaxID=454602 RepID=UPI0003B4E3A3|nr:class I adenylate-forming enzyme family protein [Spongiibacter tropicus]
MITSKQTTIDRYQASGLWEGKVLHQLLDDYAQKAPTQLAVADAPNREALVASVPHRLNYAELQTASLNLAQDLLQLGVCEDDVVIVQLPNIVELVVCYLAISRIGAIISPVPVQYGDYELEHFAKAARAKAFISVDVFKGEAFGSRRSACFSPDVAVALFGDKLTLRLTTTELPNLPDYSDANRILSLCWTSGTTGLPKGVPRSHNMWVTVARNCIEAGDYQTGDVLLNAFPMVNMASISAFLYAWVLQGCSLILHHPFDPAVFLTQMQIERVNFTIIPPAVLNQLAKDESMWQQFDFSSLRSIGSGSAPLSPWMMEKFEHDYGKCIVNYYGSNEGINLLSKPKDVPDPSVRAYMFPRFGSPGLEWPSAASKTIWTKVLNPETGDEITEPGIAGELAVKGPTVFDGYWHSDNTEVFTEDGYFLTGDLVEICGDAQQFYRIAGRCKDIINRGGMKLSPSELDVLLEGLPGAREAAVCAYPDSVLGERICACVVPVSQELAPSLDDIVRYLQAKGVSRIKLPERLELLEVLPRNALGKVQRFVLQEQIAG